MKLYLLVSIILTANLCHAQTREEILEEFRKERQEMMSEILGMFQSDSFGDSFFGDDEANPFDNIKKLRNRSNVTVEERHEDNGNISVLITPKSDKIELDIQTKNNMITIKSETKIEEESSSGGNSFKNISSSSFSQSISIPQGYIAESPIASGKGLQITLRPRGSRSERAMNEKPKDDEPVSTVGVKKRKIKLVPIGKTPGEEVI
jgi:HSP20 family molecular chaperone IbpA